MCRDTQILTLPLPFKEKSSAHIKDFHKLKLLTNFDINLTSSPGVQLKFYGRGRSDNTFKIVSSYDQFLFLPTPLYSCFRRDSLMTSIRHLPFQTSFTVTPFPTPSITLTSPHKSFDRTPGGVMNMFDMFELCLIYNL